MEFEDVRVIAHLHPEAFYSKLEEFIKERAERT